MKIQWFGTWQLDLGIVCKDSECLYTLHHVASDDLSVWQSLELIDHH